MRYTIILIMTLFIFVSCNDDADSIQKESFMKLYGGSYIDEGLSLVQLNDDSYAVIGTTTNEDELSDIYLFKTNEEGNIIWQISFGDTLNDYGSDLILDKDGNFVLTGTTTNPKTQFTDIYVSKVNAKGSKIWEKTYESQNNQTARSIILSSDGGYLIAGTTDAENLASSNPEGVLDGYALKISPTGDSLWAKTHGGPSTDQFNAVCESHSGGYIFTGSSSSYIEPGQAETSMFFIETNGIGNLIDRFTIGGLANDYGNDVISVPEGYFFLGTTNSNTAGKSDVFLISTGISFRDILFEKQFGGIGNENGNSIIRNDNGSITIAGSTDSYGEGSRDIYILNVSKNGSLINEYTFGSSAVESANDIIQTSDGGFNITGATDQSENSMIVMLKIDANYAQ